MRNWISLFEALTTPVVYHGTDRTFQKFDPAYMMTGNNDGQMDETGFYFSTSRTAAAQYGSRIVTARLHVSHPYRVSVQQWGMGQGLSPQEVNIHGFDSYVIAGQDGADTWIVFDPDVIEVIGDQDAA